MQEPLSGGVSQDQPPASEKDLSVVAPAEVTTGASRKITPEQAQKIAQSPGDYSDLLQKHILNVNETTGLPFSQERVPSETHEVLQAVKDLGGAVAVVFLDVDDLKAHNTKHGYQQTDCGLAGVASRLRIRLGEIGAGAFIFQERMGGDEMVAFVFVTPESAATAQEQVLNPSLARRLRKALAGEESNSLAITLERTLNTMLREKYQVALPGTVITMQASVGVAAHQFTASGANSTEDPIVITDKLRTQAEAKLKKRKEKKSRDLLAYLEGLATSGITADEFSQQTAEFLDEGRFDRRVILKQNELFRGLVEAEVRKKIEAETRAQATADLQSGYRDN